MTEKPPTDFDFGLVKGMLALAAFFGAVFVYIWRALGSPYRNVDDIKNRLTSVENNVTRLIDNVARLMEKWERFEERQTERRFEELERRHRPEGD